MLSVFALAHLEHQPVIMRIGPRQVLSERQNRRSDRLVGADDAPGGEVAAGRVPAEDGLRGWLLPSVVTG